MEKFQYALGEKENQGLGALKSIKTGGGDCFVKCKDSNTRLQGT